VAGIYITMLVINVSSALAPQLIRWGIDAGIYGGDLDLLGRATLLLLGLSLLAGRCCVFSRGRC